MRLTQLRPLIAAILLALLAGLRPACAEAQVSIGDDPSAIRLADYDASSNADLTSELVAQPCCNAPFGGCGCSLLDYVPSMLGDGFFSRTGPIRGAVVLDRLFYVANDLDAPNPLPGANQVLTISEPGPVGLFTSSLTSVQDIQALLRAGQPLPPVTQVGQIPDNATLTTTLTIAQIQALLASTPQGYDIIPLAAPPAGYAAGADAAFQTRIGSGGTTVFDNAGSGAMLQGGDDTLNPGDDLDAFYFYSYLVNVNINSPHAAAVRSGILKIANGGTPLPQSRLFFNYGLFDNVGLTASGDTVSRFVPGFERAFRGGMFSLEMRFPFTSAVSSDLVASSAGISNGSDVQWGDITSFVKLLLYCTDTFALSGGLAVTIPTADDISIQMPNGTPLLAVETDSVHLGPFLGGLYAPNECFFAQGFLQFDFDANGNEVLVNGVGTGLASAGRLNDPAYVFADLGLGYWLTPPGGCGRAKGVMAELHYSGSLNDSDVVRSGALQIGDGGDVNALNLTAGGTMELTRDAILSAGYVVPLTDGDDQLFDGALRLNLEYRPR